VWKKQKNILILMCGKVLFMREMCARIKHGKISMIKPLFLFQIVVPPKSTVGFVSNLKQFLFRRCRKFSPNFSIIDLAVKELHLLEVERVEFFSLQFKQNDS